MAKKRDEARAILDKVIADVKKDYTPEGAQKEVVGWASDMDPIEYMPTVTPSLQFTLRSGGWPVGKLVEFFGAEGSGKTTLMIYALLDALAYFKGERKVAIIDVEHRFNWEWAESLGLKRSETVYYTPDSAEEAADVMVKFIRSGVLAAIGFDSIGAALGEKSHASFADRPVVMAGTAAVMTRMVHQIAPKANLYNTTVFFTNQLRADMSGYNQWGASTPGGHAPKHMMSVRLYLRQGKDKYFTKPNAPSDTPEGKKMLVGFAMFFKTIKNTYGPYPREGTSDWYFAPSPEYGDTIGFDVQADIEKLAMLLGIMERNKGWYTYEGITKQGTRKLFEALEEEGLKDKLVQQVMEALGRPEDMYADSMVDLAKVEPEGPDLEGAPVDI